MAGAPLGNQNASKGKIFRSVIAKRLEERRAVEAIVDKAIEQAEEGDDKARAWLADRCDGKAVSITELTGQDGGAVQFARIERVVIDPAK